MRTKEEIAQIAEEITRRVHARRIIEEYRAYVPTMMLYEPWMNTCFHSRIRAVISAHERMKEALERYREIVNNTKAEEMGPSLEEFYKMLGVDAHRYSKSIMGLEL